MSKPQSLDDFIQSFARAHGYTAKELTGKGCQAPLVEARDFAIYEAAMAYDRDQVARAFNRLRSGISEAARRYCARTGEPRLPKLSGNRFGRRIFTDAEIKQVLKLRADGLNSTQIGKVLGRHPDSLKKLFDRLNQSLLNRPGEPPMRFDQDKDARFVERLMVQGGYPVCRSSQPAASAHKVALYSQRLLEQGRGQAYGFDDRNGDPRFIIALLAHGGYTGRARLEDWVA